MFHKAPQRSNELFNYVANHISMTLFKESRAASALQQLVDNIISCITVCSTMRGSFFFCFFGGGNCSRNMSPAPGGRRCGAGVTDSALRVNTGSSTEEDETVEVNFVETKLLFCPRRLHLRCNIDTSLKELVPKFALLVSEMSMLEY